MVACGEGEGASGGADATAELAAQPEPQEPISEAMVRVNEALARGDCESFVVLGHSQGRATPEPGAPATNEECRNVETLLTDLEGAEFVESEEFGTAAITEGPAPEGASEREGEAVALTWMLDSDGTWGHVSSFTGDPQIGEEPAGDPLPSVETFIEATREDDCSLMSEVLDANGRLAESGSLRDACRVVTEGQAFAPALEATPETEPVNLGGTLDIAFVGVPTKEEYFTVLLGTPEVRDLEAEQQIDMLVSDVRGNTLTPDEILPRPAED